MSRQINLKPILANDHGFRSSPDSEKLFAVAAPLIGDWK